MNRIISRQKQMLVYESIDILLQKLSLKSWWDLDTFAIQSDVNFRLCVCKQINTSTHEFCQKSFNEGFVCILFKYFHIYVILIDNISNSKEHHQLFFTCIVCIHTRNRGHLRFDILREAIVQNIPEFYEIISQTGRGGQ